MLIQSCQAVDPERMRFRFSMILLWDKFKFCMFSVLSCIHVTAEKITSLLQKTPAQMTKLAASYTMTVGTNLHGYCHDHTTNETKEDHNL